MSDNENNNKDLKPEGGSSPPTDQVSQTDAPAVGSENNDTSSAENEEKNPQTPPTDNDKDKDKVKVKKLKEEKSLTKRERKTKIPIRKIITTFPIR